MICLGPVCTTPNGWCVLILMLTAAGVVWAWGKYGATGW
jgi:hypothetical protein